MRTAITLSCPGSLGAATVLTSTPEQSQWGIGHPRNAGGCPLSIGALDASGSLLQPNLALQPGESAEWYTPPAGTARIVVACFENCTGETVLEFDLPVA